MRASWRKRLPLKILHVEDDPLDAELIKWALSDRQVPCSITVVDTEQAFKAALAKGEIDVILSDSNLPGFDTFHALDYVKRVYPGIPFIFVSGDVSAQRRTEAFKRGATDAIEKSNMAKLARELVWVSFKTRYSSEPN